jgi:hypothetical protein
MIVMSLRNCISEIIGFEQKNVFLRTTDVISAGAEYDGKKYL